MIDQEISITKYIGEKKELQELVLQIIDKSNSENEKDFQNLVNFLDTHQYNENKPEINHFFHLILNISLNHNRQPNFFDKIEKILTITSRFYKPLFSTLEYFTIFQQSKPILLILLKTKIITIDELTFKYLLNFSDFIDEEVYYYFYPELDSIIKSGIFNDINEKKYKIKMNEDIENFESNRQKFENVSNICTIIREDKIDDFITYIHQANIAFSSQIKRSIFETNSMLIEKEPTLIEYAAFFGSIQIVKYLANHVEIDSSLWLYAVHSNNAEIIQFLEEKQIERDDRTFSEAIKCHHNDIARYIFENYFDISNIKDLNEETVLTIYSSANYEFFSNEIDGNNIFFSLCKNEYYELINLYLSFKKQEIEDFISQQKQSETKEIIHKALEANRLDVAYHLLLEFDNVPENYFKTNRNITKISLPPNIHSIKSYSFSDCQSLQRISIPSTLTEIEGNCFLYCKSLIDVTFPSTITELKFNTFKACVSLKEFTIPFSVKSMSFSFDDCHSLQRISIPSLITKIECGVFLECNSLTEVIIPPTVTCIETFAFRNCTSLKRIYIPSSVTHISEDSFRHCHSLTQINIPSSVTHIGLNSFNDCKSLKQLTIPSSVISIRENSFSNCTSLTDVIISSSLSKISFGLFYNCSSLKKISIPSSIQEIDKYAFYECTALTHVFFDNDSDLLAVDSYAFGECKSLQEIQLPPSVLGVAPYAFINCESLKQIPISSVMKLIGSYSFNGCSSLTEFSIPKSIEMMGKSIFNGCSSLKKVTMPSFINKDDLGIETDVDFTII